MSLPQRLYSFSDTYGGPNDPLSSPDADALISTDLRTGRQAHREFDIYGQERVTAHILRLVRDLHGQVARRTDWSERRKGNFFEEERTGIFINSAPRTGHDNGSDFYVAEVRPHLRVVTTPLSALSAVRGDVTRLQRLPNQNNGLYPNGEQFRSSYTPILLDPKHGIELEDCDPSIIPQAPDGWELAYVDRFGNLITHTEHRSETDDHIRRISDDGRKRIWVVVGDQRRLAKVGSTLGANEPGQLSIYGNGNLDIARKWAPGESARERLDCSAYAEFGKPSVGAPVSADQD